MLDSDIITILTHSIANSVFISFLRDVSHQISHLCKFSLLLGDVTPEKTFHKALVFGVLWEIHQPLVDSHHIGPEMGIFDVFFVVSQSMC